MSKYNRTVEVQQIYEKADACITDHNDKGLYGCYVELFDIMEPSMRNVIYKEFSRRGTPCTYEDVEDLLQELKFALFRFSVYNYRKSKNKETYYKIPDKETTEAKTASFNAYCIAILKNVAMDCTKHGQKIYYNEEELNYVNEEGEEVSKIERQISVSNELVELDTREIIIQLTNYMLDEIFNSHQAPQRILALCYVKYVPILFAGERTGSPQWAYAHMNKPVGQLSVKFRKIVSRRYNKDDAVWCAAHKERLNSMYQCRDSVSRVLKEVVYTDEFTQGNLRVWSNRIGDIINKTAIMRMQSEGEAEMLSALKEYKKARELLKDVRGEER